ncbi:MAG: kinase [Flavobacteriaceae bacterium]|nr:MAG: kinase [Flavobacteriaceae bacterium]
MSHVFVMGGASYNSVITLDKLPGNTPQTIHNCHFKETIGNTGAGKALSLATLGFRVDFHALVGDDTFATHVKSYLNKPLLHFLTDIDPKGTERHLNILNAEGERISIFINPSSDTPNVDYLKLAPFIKKADYVVLNIANYCRYAIDMCVHLNKTIWTDLHDYDGKNQYHQDFIDAADYIFLSSDNLPNYKVFMKSQIKKGKKLVVCTHAKDGATALNEFGEWITQPIFDAFKMKNANGAGDAFFSGFLYGHQKGYDIKKCMRYAAIVAGMCVESMELWNEKCTAEFIQKKQLELQ